jgi:putative ABC transport system permease protein
VSFRQVFRQRRRSLGVALAIALGTAALIVIITMGQDIKESLNKDLELLGGATRIKIHFDMGQKKYSSSRPPWFREGTASALRRLPGVTGVSLVSCRDGIELCSRHDRRFRLKLLVGVDEFFWDVNSFSPVLGRFFGHDEIKGRERVCVLGEDLAKKIFGDENAVGKLLDIENNFYRVIGVLGGLGMGSRINYAFIPYTTASDRIRGEWVPDLIYIRCHTWDDVEKVAAAIPEVIRSNQPAEGIKIEVAWNHLKRVKRMAWWIEFFVQLAIAATLILGGFGIWNIMTAGVQSRTREIGLKKAIGAEGRDILAQFLAEALCLSLSAALIGVVIGRSVIEAMSFILDCHPPEDLFLLCVGLGLLFSVILGIGAGIVPSIRASRMEVVYAIRFE